MFRLKKGETQFALKVLSGSEDAWPLVIADILEQIDYDNKETIKRLYQLRSKDILNDNGKAIGHAVVHRD